MTELFLDGMRVYTTPQATIKLSAENTYFTKAASYTYDVELPLGIPDNHRVFGDIDRLDVHKQTRTLQARLVVDNTTVLIGTAHITAVSDKSVKVQLLGEASSYNYGNKMGNLYVDEIDLGDWYWETWPDGSCVGGPRGRGSSSTWENLEEGTEVCFAFSVLERARYIGPEHGLERYTEAELLWKLIGGDFGWVAYPTYNTTSDIRINAIAYKETSAGSRQYEAFLRSYEGEARWRRETQGDKPVASFAIQPFVWKMAEIIAKRTGFPLDRQDNALYTDEFLRQIFVANTSTSALCRECLPHWTVNEWWTQVENTFGVVMVIDYEHGKMTLHRRADHYISAPVVSLDNILDEYDTTLEDGTQQDISVNNVGFADFENGAEDLLSDEILASAEYMDFDTMTELLEWCDAHHSVLGSYKNVIFRCGNGRQFIYSTNVDSEDGIIEVNMFRPRMVNDESDDIEIELKIVPAAYTKSVADLYATENVQPGAAHALRDIPDGTFDVRMMQVPGKENVAVDQEYADSLDIQAIIEEEEDTTTNRESHLDLLYIGIKNSNVLDRYVATVTLATGGVITDEFDYPRALLRERCFAKIGESVETEDPNKSLSLIPIDGQINLASASLSGLVSIGTTVRHCIKFVRDAIPDVGAVFNIHNKMWVCEKIEANIKVTGLDKMMTGYFYEFTS